MHRSILFTRIVTRTDQVVSHLQRLHFSGFHPPAAAWQPAVNMYLYPERVEVCVDLAGVDARDLSVEVTPGCLVIRGDRLLPGRGCGPLKCERILMMEIADGTFERSLELPLEVDARGVRAQQENGWLWIILPKTQPEPCR